MKASDLPLSILIVGVGGADFKEMEVPIHIYASFYARMWDYISANIFYTSSIIRWKSQLSIEFLQISKVFECSQILDADKGEILESSTGRVASRDIVQFVPFRHVQSKRIYYSDK